MKTPKEDVDVNVKGVVGYKFLNNKQTMFVGYTLFVLVDLVVLNFFDEYWHYVEIESFTVSLLAACLLQLLLKLSIKAEHSLAIYFNKKSGKGAKFMRWFSAYLILVGSKFLMMGVLDVVFGDRLKFGGVVQFYAVAIAVIVAEALMTAIYYKLADKEVVSEEVE